MKNRIIIIFLILAAIFCSGSYDYEVRSLFISYQPNVDRLETMFKTYIPPQKGIMFTKVPRGLIISVDEKMFFNEGEARIKESSLIILDTICVVLNRLSNYCIIEDHTEDNDLTNSYYRENWELSIARAGNIVQYMSAYCKIPADKLFALGYGEYMPFRDNVAPKNGMDSRIDFVILEYEAMR
ncbi:chemotaxis MotB protein [Clostridium sp. CAG:967]|nr:chemotaxis MotB protein [Clostridium sp. CAG:967]